MPKTEEVKRKIIITPNKNVFDRYCYDNKLDPREQIWINSKRNIDKLRGLKIKTEDVIYLKWWDVIDDIKYIQDWINIIIRN